MIYHLRHLTSFRYTQPVTFVYNALHLKPRELPWQKVQSFRLSVGPEPAVRTEGLDYFGNPTQFFSIEQQHDAMSILTESVVDVLPRESISRSGLDWEESLKRLPADTGAVGLDAFQFAFDSPYSKKSPEVRAYALQSCQPGRSIHAVATDLMKRIYTDFTFDAKATTISTPVLEVFESRRGVCQDFAHLMITALRSLGLAARYMSGYIQTIPPPGQLRLAGADASHAWVAVYCPLAGWLELDPTNNQAADTQYITLGWGRDYQDISPANGVLLGGGEHTVHAQVDMIPEFERPVPSGARGQQQQQQQQ